MSMSKELIEVLACPKCKGDVTISENSDAIICRNCRLMFKIKDGIPIMLIEEAITIPE